jgi:hypothetical protein
LSDSRNNLLWAHKPFLSPPTRKSRQCRKRHEMVSYLCTYLHVLMTSYICTYIWNVYKYVEIVSYICTYIFLNGFIHMYIHIFKWLHTYVQTCFNCFIFCNGLIPMYINWIRYIFWDGFIDMHICTYICWTTGDIRFADERSSPLPYCIFLIVYIPINWACCKMLKCEWEN